MEFLAAFLSLAGGYFLARARYRHFFKVKRGDLITGVILIALAAIILLWA